MAVKLGLELDEKNINYFKYGVDHFLKDMETFGGVPSWMTATLMTKSGLLNALAIRDKAFELEQRMKDIITVLHSMEKKTRQDVGYLRGIHDSLKMLRELTKLPKFAVPRKSARTLRRVIEYKAPEE